MNKNFYILKNGKLIRKYNTIYFIYQKQEENNKVFKAEIDEEEFDVETENIANKLEYEKRILPIEQIGNLFLYGRVSLTSGVISLLCKKSIPVHFFGYYGNYEGSIIPKESLLSGKMHINQAAHYLDYRKRILLARKFIEGASLNMLRNLKYYQSEGRDFESKIEYIENEIKKITNIIDINKLRALEGGIRNKYYACFDVIIKNTFKFEKRTKQPPLNPINAMISFGNALLYSTIIKNIYHTQLNQTIAFLHEPSERRYSLSLDLSEIFKPLIVDRVIFKLTNKQIITEKHFVKELNSCLLNEKGKKIFVMEYEKKLNSTIKHRSLKRNVSYERLIYLECIKLCKHLLGMKKYEPFVIWW
ncbi:MAG: type I-B CRISPR-associated endonuclease Cas1b [Candidatus Heimdallarchaeum endolithica]|uniref:CRISPR-associated endonuclease Cas1 n=1 Tax=Candidatus Heimdallarchaeum endolithica TaxID=2876572 RepID=A0A9Y1BQR3_9ARCH|nr:MAG: type I-B CRISPR-associated endonuclease Cas1b [Candidatus Heimdallarchaeum endolithica]